MATGPNNPANVTKSRANWNKLKYRLLQNDLILQLQKANVYGLSLNLTVGKKSASSTNLTKFGQSGLFKGHNSRALKGFHWFLNFAEILCLQTLSPYLMNVS